MSKHVSYTRIEFKDGVRFNVLGLLNTPKDNSVYNIKAFIGAGSNPIKINSVDWENSNQRQFKFNNEEDFYVTDKTRLNENSCIVF